MAGICFTGHTLFFISPDSISTSFPHTESTRDKWRRPVDFGHLGRKSSLTCRGLYYGPLSSGQNYELIKADRLVQVRQGRGPLQGPSPLIDSSKALEGKVAKTEGRFDWPAAKPRWYPSHATLLGVGWVSTTWETGISTAQIFGEETAGGALLSQPQ